MVAPFSTALPPPEVPFILINEDLPNQVIGVTNIPPTINYCGIWVDAYKDKWQIKYIMAVFMTILLCK